MLCINCNDQVCWRHEKEGVIHKHGRYTCRVRTPGDPYTVAEVGADAEKRLQVAASVKVPEDEKPAVRSGRQKTERWSDD